MAGTVWDSSRRTFGWQALSGIAVEELWVTGTVWDRGRRIFGWQALSGVAVEELLGGTHCLG